MAEWEGIEKPILATSVRFPRGAHTKYVPNHRSFAAFMRSDQMRDVTEEVANDIVALAAEFTPTSDSSSTRHTGLHARVKSGFKVKRNAGLIKVAGNLRVRVDVVNNKDGAALLEFGARGLAPSRMLARAGMAVHPTADFKPEGGGHGSGPGGVA